MSKGELLSALVSGENPSFWLADCSRLENITSAHSNGIRTIEA